MTTNLTPSRHVHFRIRWLCALMTTGLACLSSLGHGKEYDRAELLRMVWEKDYPELKDSPEDRQVAEALLRLLGGHRDSIGHVYLPSCFTDADLPILLPFQDARSIFTSASQLTNEGMRFLRQMKSLQVVEPPPGVTDEGLAHLHGLPLRGLRLPPQATDKCMNTILSLPELNGVRLSRNITDNGFRQMAKLKKLTGISLHDSQVSDAAFESVAGNPGIWYVDFGTAPNITPEVAQYLQELPNLRWLIGPPGTNDRTLELLAPVKSLTFLDLSTYDGVTDEGMKYMPSFERLHQLKLGANITDAGIKHLGKLEYLLYLDLVKTQVTGKGLAFLGPFGPYDLKISDSVSDEGLASISEFTRLASLELHGNFTDACLPHLPMRLEAVTFRGTKVTKEGLRKLQRERPALDITARDEDGIYILFDE